MVIEPTAGIANQNRQIIHFGHFGSAVGTADWSEAILTINEL